MYTNRSHPDQHPSRHGHHQGHHQEGHNPIHGGFSHNPTQYFDPLSYPYDVNDPPLFDPFGNPMYSTDNLVSPPFDSNEAQTHPHQLLNFNQGHLPSNHHVFVPTQAGYFPSNDTHHSVHSASLPLNPHPAFPDHNPAQQFHVQPRNEHQPPPKEYMWSHKHVGKEFKEAPRNRHVDLDEQIKYSPENTKTHVVPEEQMGNASYIMSTGITEKQYWEYMERKQRERERQHWSNHSSVRR